LKTRITTVLLFTAMISFGQPTKSIDWETIKNNDKLPKQEVSWLHDNLTSDEFEEVIGLVSALSRPAAAQMLASHLYLDGSYTRSSIKPYLDSLIVRPPDGDAGTIRVAYLVSKLRKELIDIGKSNKFYTAEFSGALIKVPEFKDSNINKKIELSFDYQPALVILDILSEPDATYQDILQKLDLHQFDQLIKHHNQSFYPTPLNKERLVTCLEIATSTKPIDQLYKYMNPDGLLYFTDVKTNLLQYKQQVKALSENEQSIFKYINASIAPLLPSDARFSRKVSFFFIDGADGWASDDVTAIDLNYYKDDYLKLLPLLAHETYHSGQNAVAINDPTKREENIQFFAEVMDYVFREGTASYIAPPSIKTNLEKDIAIKKGIQLLEEIHSNTIVNYDAEKAQQLANEGIAGAGPFYWLGAEMSRVIVIALGKEKLASIIPFGGITFFKTYIAAVEKSNKNENMFDEPLIEYIQKLK